MTTSSPEALLQLPDGRVLGYSDHGRPGDATVFGIHGTPGSRHQVLPDANVVPEGVRYVVVDRPGYGVSSDHPRRSLLSFARDLEVLADHLGVDRLGLFGVSGGGPHALACAARLGPRVACTCLVGPIRPTADRESSVGMMPSNRLLTTVSRAAPVLLRPIMYATVGLLRLSGERGIEQMLAASPPVDRELLRRKRLGPVFLDHFRAPDGRTARASADDFALFAAPWGFDIGAIETPVWLYHGTLDRNSPLAHSEWLAARLPRAELVALPGEGHFGYLDRMPELLRVAATGPPTDR